MDALAEVYEMAIVGQSKKERIRWLQRRRCHRWPRLNNTHESLVLCMHSPAQPLTSGTVARCIRVEWQTGRFRVTNPPRIQAAHTGCNMNRVCKYKSWVLWFGGSEKELVERKMSYGGCCLDLLFFA